MQKAIISNTASDEETFLLMRRLPNSSLFTVSCSQQNDALINYERFLSQFVSLLLGSLSLIRNGTSCCQQSTAITVQKLFQRNIKQIYIGNAEGIVKINQPSFTSHHV